jgi:integrase
MVVITVEVGGSVTRIQIPLSEVLSRIKLESGVPLACPHDAIADASEGLMEGTTLKMIDLISLWTADLQRRGLSETNWWRYEDTAKKYVAAMKVETVEDFTAESVTRWLGELSAEGNGGKTLNNKLCHLMSLGQFAKKTKKLKENPCEDIDPASTHHSDTGVRAFRVEEVRALIRSVRTVGEDRRRTTRRADVYAIAFLTGLRRGELASLHWNDVILEDPDGFPRLELRRAATKAKRADVLPLPPEAVEILAEMRARVKGVAGPVFDALPIYTTLVEDCKRANVDLKTREGPVGFHSFRKAYISECAKRMSPAQLRIAARHTDLRTTQRSYLSNDILTASMDLAGMPRLNEGENKAQNSIMGLAKEPMDKYLTSSWGNNRDADCSSEPPVETTRVAHHGEEPRDARPSPTAPWGFEPYSGQLIEQLRVQLAASQQQVDRLIRVIERQHHGDTPRDAEPPNDDPECRRDVPETDPV